MPPPAGGLRPPPPTTTHCAVAGGRCRREARATTSSARPRWSCPPQEWSGTDLDLGDTARTRHSPWHSLAHGGRPSFQVPVAFAASPGSPPPTVGAGGRRAGGGPRAPACQEPASTDRGSVSHQQPGRGVRWPWRSTSWATRNWQMARPTPKPHCMRGATRRDSRCRAASSWPTGQVESGLTMATFSSLPLCDTPSSSSRLSRRPSAFRMDTFRLSRRCAALSWKSPPVARWPRRCLH